VPVRQTALRLWGFYQTPDGKKMFRYLMVSIISAVMSFTLLGIVFGVLRWWSEVPSTLFANAVVMVPNYYLNRYWVWGKTGRSHWRREVLPFWVITFAGVALSIVAAGWAHHISTTNHLSQLAATALLLAVILVAFGVLWVLKFVIFNRLFHVAPVAIAEPVPD
jgi:putative flippase GtrA